MARSRPKSQSTTTQESNMENNQNQEELQGTADEAAGGQEATSTESAANESSADAASKNETETPKEETVIQAKPELTPVVEAAPVKVAVVHSPRAEELLAKIKASGNIALSISFDQLNQYIEDMAPGKTMPEDQGVMHQINLWRSIRNVIENGGAQFRLAFGTLLRIFDEHKNGVFHERYIFRFTEQLTLPPTEQQAFRRIVNLIKIAAASEGREEAIRQVDFKKTLQFGFSEQAKSNILEFFNK